MCKGHTCSVYNQSAVDPEARSTVHLHLEFIKPGIVYHKIREKPGSPVLVCPLHVSHDRHCPQHGKKYEAAAALQ